MYCGGIGFNGNFDSCCTVPFPISKVGVGQVRAQKGQEQLLLLSRYSWADGTFLAAMSSTRQLLLCRVCLFAIPRRGAVCIHSPPRAAGGQSITDMYDPDTYHQKFAQYGEIVFITICLQNGNLMKVCRVEHNTNSSGIERRT